jgi:hypothetical protein
VRAVLVVMLDVAPQDANELLAADDQQLVEALPADRADPAFGVCVRAWRLHGRQMTWLPVECQTPSNTLVNLASWSRINNFHAAACEVPPLSRRS